MLRRNGKARYSFSLLLLCNLTTFEKLSNLANANTAMPLLSGLGRYGQPLDIAFFRTKLKENPNLLSLFCTKLSHFPFYYIILQIAISSLIFLFFFGGNFFFFLPMDLSGTLNFFTDHKINF